MKNLLKINSCVFSTVFGFLFVIGLFCGCTQSASVFQYSTIQALANGDYFGQLPCEKLIEHGNIGIGTFNDLDGEMVILDGRIYQVKSDGSVSSGKELHTPFAIVCNWPDYRCNDNVGRINFSNLSQLIAYLDESLQVVPQHKIINKSPELSMSDWRLGKNNLVYFNILRMEGEFEYLKLRSVPKQSRPYPKLAEVVKKQSVFERRNIRGTLIGFRCPDNIGGLNVPGWHFHFISDDRKVGGHVLDIAGHDLAATIIPAQEYRLILPDSDDFRRTATQPVEASTVHKIEK